MLMNRLSDVLVGRPPAAVRQIGLVLGRCWSDALSASEGHMRYTATRTNRLNVEAMLEFVKAVP